MSVRWFSAPRAVGLSASLLFAACHELPSREDINEPAVQSPEEDHEGPSLDLYITSGQRDPGHPMVGLVRAGSSACTGTLIAPAAALTAGHCCKSSSMTFQLGGSTYAAQQVIVHPNYGSSPRVDLCVMRLRDNVPGIQPSPLFTAVPRSGQAITLVGFGRTSTGSGFGTKYFGTNTISSVDSTGFRFSGASNVCDGDSGGPTFIEVNGAEHVAGVHSTKSGTACGSGGRDMRVDVFANWIASTAGTQAPPPIEPPPGGSEPPSEPPPAPPGDCHSGAVFGSRYCNEGCLCGEGEGDCDGDDECETGLVCARNVGSKYGVDSGVDVCEKPAGSPPAEPPPSGQDPPSVDPPQGGSPEATEGQSCASSSCAAGLACTTVFRSSTGETIGKFCMERCTNVGRSDPACDGGESCTNSRSAGPVCFNPSNSSQGYTSPGGSTTPPPSTPPPSTPPPSTPPPSTPPPSTPPPANCSLNAQEAEVFSLLNQERGRQGLGALSCDPIGAAVARAHSQDMCDRGYFNHTNPEGQRPWDRLRAAGASFSGAGENIARGQRTSQAVHDAWMNSSGHRSNMLNSRWRRTGIGYVACGGRPLWTEVFMN